MIMSIFGICQKRCISNFSIVNLLILKLLEEELGSQMSKEVGSWRFVDRLWSWILNGELFSWWVYDRSLVHQGVFWKENIVLLSLEIQIADES
jgi:hypothetical protein